MATTTTLAQDIQAEKTETARTPAPTGPADDGTPRQTPPSAGTAGAPASSYSLLSPPNYDGIVGGVPPSPYASIILLGGFLSLIAAAIGTGMGQDMSQWWILGAMLITVAIFLAGFVSRSA